MTRHTVPPELSGERADKIVSVLGDVSRSEAKALIEACEVTVDDRIVEARTRVSEGATIEFELGERAPLLRAEPVEFGVVYEDPHLAVVDKPSGVITHPGSAGRTGSLAAGLLHRYPQIEGVGTPGRWGIVHRLDRDTSGLLVVALTDQAQAALSKAMRRREIHRRYLALVDGVFDAPRGTIEAPIAADPSRPTRRVVAAGGRPARTHYRRIDEWRSDEVTLLSVELETGRTHQIRVHMAAIDHPVIGDRWYGRPARVDAPRVFLHAAELEFDHPITGERVLATSPLPDDLRQVLDDLARPATQ